MSYVELTALLIWINVGNANLDSGEAESQTIRFYITAKLVELMYQKRRIHLRRPRSGRLTRHGVLLEAISAVRLAGEQINSGRHSMRLHHFAKLFAGAAMIGGLALAAAPAQAAYVIPGTGFAGVAGGGNTGLDAFGQTWTWNTTIGGVTPGVPAGNSAWGSPGLGLGTVDHYTGTSAATNFEIAFQMPDGTDISQIPSSGPGGYNEATRFDVCSASGCVEWNAVFSNPTHAHEVDFFAPAGSSLKFGDQYFVNVVMDNGLVSGATNAGFSAVFTGVPEPSTWAMMLMGVGGVGAAMRMARRKTGAAAMMTA
jgi:hypothetical protein